MILVCLCLLCSAAFAEETEEAIELNWEDIAEEVKAQGEFRQKEIPGECTVSYWIPSIMKAGETTNSTMYSMDDKHIISIGLTKLMMSVEDTAALLEQTGIGSGFRSLTINGVDCISYETTDSNFESLIFPLTSNTALNILCTSLDGDTEWAATVYTIFSSVQKAE